MIMITRYIDSIRNYTLECMMVTSCIYRRKIMIFYTRSAFRRFTVFRKGALLQLPDPDTGFTSQFSLSLLVKQYYRIHAEPSFAKKAGFFACDFVLSTCVLQLSWFGSKLAIVCAWTRHPIQINLEGFLSCIG